MIKGWLRSHRWVNELMKTFCAGGFAWFAYVSWEGGKLASLEIAIVESYKIMVFGIFAGMLGMLSLFIMTDVVYSLWKLRKGEGR